MKAFSTGHNLERHIRHIKEGHFPRGNMRNRILHSFLLSSINFHLDYYFPITKSYKSGFALMKAIKINTVLSNV
jgi:hypothetical protein